MKAQFVKPSQDIYQKITDLFVDKLEQGVSPWRKTWTGVNSNHLIPQNYFTKKCYRGINLFLLALSPYSLPYFCTFNQAKAQGYCIKKGAKSLPVVYWNIVESKTEIETLPDGTEAPKKSAFIKYYNVFNIEDVEGINLEPLLNAPANIENTKIDFCESIINGMPKAPKIQHLNRNSAYYNPLSDVVNMPPLAQFDNAGCYYATFYHELIHSTGHRDRLNRDTVTQLCPFGSTNYSKEELVAELGASFLYSLTGIANADILNNSAAYLRGWLKPLKDDKKLIFWAAKEAQKAVAFIAPDLLVNEPEEAME